MDDDFDTLGDFFWTGIRGEQRVVSSSWVLDMRLERMVEGEKSSNKRLCQPYPGGVSYLYFFY